MQEDVMPKRYAMSAGLSALERIALLACFGLLVICWLCAACSGISFADRETPEYVWLAVFCSLTVLFLTIVRLLVARDLLRTYWDISGETVGKKSPARIVSVEFTRIVRLKFYHVWGLFAFGMIVHQGGRLILSFFIRDLAELLEDLRRGIDRAGRPGVYDAANLDGYARTIKAAEGRDRRLERFMPVLIRTMVTVLCVTILTAIYLWHFPVLLGFLWGVIVLVFFLCSVMIAEAVLALCQGRADDRKGLSPDAAVYMVTGMLALVTCLSCGILLTAALGL
jgi:hypothetical protein